MELRTGLHLEQRHPRLHAVAPSSTCPSGHLACLQASALPRLHTGPWDGCPCSCQCATPISISTWCDEPVVLHAYAGSLLRSNSDVWWQMLAVASTTLGVGIFPSHMFCSYLCE